MTDVLLFDTATDAPWLVATAKQVNGRTLRDCLGRSFEFKSYGILDEAIALPNPLHVPATVDIISFVGKWEEVRRSGEHLFFMLDVDRRQFQDRLARFFLPQPVPYGTEAKVIHDALRHWKPV